MVAQQKSSMMGDLRWIDAPLETSLNFIIHQEEI